MAKAATGDAVTLDVINGVAEGDTPIERAIGNVGVSTVTGNQDDYDLDALAGVGEVGIQRLDWNGASAVTFRGLDGGLEGRVLLLQNITAGQSATVNHQDTNSLAANRIITATGAAVTLAAGQMAVLVYDGTNSRWRLFTFGAGGATYALNGWAGTGTGATFSPADSTTYYFGKLDSLTLPNPKTSAGNVKVYLPKAGRITHARVTVRVNGTLGSTETSTISIRLNNTTDTTLSSSVQANAAEQTFSSSALSIAVVAGDYVEFKWVTPAWATNPTDVQLSWQLFVEP